MKKQILFAFLPGFLLAQNFSHTELFEHEPHQNVIINEDAPDLSTDIQAQETVSAIPLLMKSPSSEIAATKHAKSSLYLISSLKGVLFIPDRSYVAKSGVVVEGFQAIDMDIPGGLNKINAELREVIS